MAFLPLLHGLCTCTSIALSGFSAHLEKWFWCSWNWRLLLQLLFEAKLAMYFETTMSWHASAGSLGSRPSFWMMEIHDLFFDFISPWWTRAKNLLEECFPETIKFLEKNEMKEESWELKRQQLLAGINAGYKELCKMSKHVLSTRFLFLHFCNAMQGPALLRAVIWDSQK